MGRRLGLLNVLLRHCARPFLRRTKTPERAARDFRLVSRILFRMPRGAALRRTRATAAVPAMTRITCGPADAGRAILYFHGGGYVAGSARTHAAMLARLAQLSGLAVEAPDYRLAQEAPFPAAFEDALAAWDALLDRGLAPGGIVLGGDSAGGGLALALLALLCARGTPPAGLFAFSPWTDLSLGGASLAGNAKTDAILPVARVEELVGIVAQGADRRDPRLSPLFADFPGAPPVLLQASRTEILLDDTLRMAERLRGQGAEVAVVLAPDAPHVWQIFDGWIPEARASLDEAARFARRCLSPAPPRSGS